MTAEIEEQIAAALQARWLASIAELTDDERSKLFGWLPVLARHSETHEDRSDRAVGGGNVFQISPIDGSERNAK